MNYEREMNNNYEQEMDNYTKPDSEIDYKQEYKKKKQLYLMKKREMLSKAHDNAAKTIALNNKEKVIVSQTNQDYQKLIATLEDYCKKESSFSSQFKEGTNKLLQNIENFLNKFDININTSKIQSGIDSNNFKKMFCQNIQTKIIPYLKDRQDLQAKLVEHFNKFKTDGSVNIDNYLNYAKDHGLTLSNLSNIFKDYDTHLTKVLLNNKAALVAATANANANTKSKISSVTSTISVKPSSGGKHESCAIPNKDDFGYVASKDDFGYGTSKHGHQCVSKCEKKPHLFGESKMCNTQPYEKYFLNWDWDYCK